MVRLTKKEQAIINRLHSLAKVWPSTLWLFSGSGDLYVMKKRDGKRAMLPLDDGVDPSYIVCKIAIENDGGDW